MPTPSMSPLEVALRQRGLVPTREARKDDLMLSLHLVQAEAVIESDTLERFRHAFGKASFRKIARTLLAAHGEPVPFTKLSDIAGKKTDEYLDVLAALEMIECGEVGIRLLRTVDNLGPTLEWYVADLCKRELAASAAWGVQLEELPHGGDYDVLALFGFGIAYIEAKTAKPSSIPKDDILNFLKRTTDLQPELSVFLIDTSDPLDEFITRFVDTARFPVPDWPQLTAWIGWPTAMAPVNGAPGVYFGAPNTYIANSEPSILTQLQRCLRHFHGHGRQAFVRAHAPDPLAAIESQFARSWQGVGLV